MFKNRFIAFLLLLAAASVGYFVYSSQVNGTKFAFKYGLDLSGGTHLVYKADTSKLASGDVAGAMSALRDVIERRVNLFGVSEPVVQVEQGGIISGNGEQRLIVELPGVTDVKQAIAMIGQTPLLEFKLVNETAANELNSLQGQASSTDPAIIAKIKDLQQKVFIDSGLTGRYLKSSQLIFDQTTGMPKVGITFNSEGSALFAKITKENVGKMLAIFLDGATISTPVIRQEIPNGQAEISGNFTPDEAKKLVRDLNYGALPIPIGSEPVITETIGASLGEGALNAGLKAGIIAYLVIGLFLLLWYRLPGLVAVISLAIYVILNLALFKLIPVTLTAAGIAGFILSMGMAVDANILIFERMKEELARGRNLSDAMHEGFSRAWLSIRDSNLSSIITAVILFWFASTPVIKGFALVFGIGVLTSMFTAITASRTLLFAIKPKNEGAVSRFLFSCGLHSGKQMQNVNIKNQNDNSKLKMS
ncbi:MAG: protein translocase subunit SecD [Candidatus Paceibacterota bacterium]